MPVGMQYLAFLGLTLGSVVILARRQAISEPARHPWTLWWSALWAWLLLSALWSSGPWRDQLTAMWSYTLPLALAPLAMACGREHAWRALGHFTAASAAVATLYLVTLGGSYGTWPTWRPIVDITGNQRVAVSLLLALGDALAALLAWRATSRAARLAWLGACALILAGLVLQDRRTGMLVAPLLLAALVLLRQQGGKRRLAMLTAVMALAAGGWWGLPQVQQRFDEGLRELQEHQLDGRSTTSWSMRATLAEETWQMLRERPLAGHGVGSWATHWRLRMHDAEPLLQGHSTPHSEVLLLGMQGGSIALLLAAGAIASAWREGRRRGPEGHALLLVLLTLCAAGWISAVLRDTRFALPLLLLTGLAWAASSGPRKAAEADASQASARASAER